MDIIRKIEKTVGIKDFIIKEDKTFYFNHRMMISTNQDLRDKVLREADNTPKTTHASSMKM